MSLVPSEKQPSLTQWRPGLSPLGRVFMLIFGAVFTAFAWRIKEIDFQLAVALFGQLFWVLTYLDWQRSRFAPRAIRKFLSNYSTRLPCQVLVVVEEIELLREAGVLVVEGGKLRFHGKKMQFDLSAQNVDQILPDIFPFEGRLIKLKCSDAKFTLKVVPYDRFASEQPTTGEDLNALMDSLRMEMKSRAEPTELPFWPFPRSLVRRLRVRGWLLFLSALPLFAALLFALSLKDEVFKFFVVSQALLIGMNVLRGAGRARRARYFVRNSLEEAERRAVRPSESVLAAPASIASMN